MLDLNLNWPQLGAVMHALVEQLYPICRSITGNGVRTTLAELSKHIPITTYEVPTGTRVFDWTIPKEWNIREAFIKDASGRTVVDFREHNLHVLNYSVPIHETMPLAKLKEHVHTLPDQPNRVPYRTSYFKETWGFCMEHRRLEESREGEYEVCIDSTLEPGSLTYGECLIRGRTDEEFLFSSHVCHPSLANDNLSSIAVAVSLAQLLLKGKPRYTYRFVFAPGTIGAITWLAQHEESLSRIRHGLVLACLGDSGPFHYKLSRRGDAVIDKAVAHVLASLEGKHEILPFTPYGYDERQYCSPGIDLPVGCFMRTPPGQFPEYHTSGDNLDFVRPQSLAESLAALVAVVDVLERNQTFVNQNPKCEPQLGRRGLYSALGGTLDKRERELAMLWVLNYSDGAHSLLDIANKAKAPFHLIAEVAGVLEEAALLRSASRAH